MPQVDVYNVNREVVDKLDLASWWEEGVTPGLIHQAVVAARSGARRGTAATKTRARVSGGGRKPFRQKGTGNARQGSSRAPQMKGGAVIFGPQPKSWAKSINRKMSKLALRGALVSKVAEASLVVLDRMALSAPRTKDLVDIMDRFDVVSALVVVDEVTQELSRAADNLTWVKVVPVGSVNTYDVLAHEKLMVTRKALEALEGTVSP